MKTDALWQLVSDWDNRRVAALNFAACHRSDSWETRAQALKECLRELAFTLRKIEKLKRRKKRKPQ
jgi:hypothetical protein